MEKMPITPVGEDAEPFWRNHDSSLQKEKKWETLHRSHHHELTTSSTLSQQRTQREKDWDDSHWFLGEHYWLGQRYHRPNLWKAAANLFKSRRPDSVIKDEVTYALSHDPSVDSEAIRVSVKRGHITLSGFVFDQWMKEQAQEAIYFLPGVEGVKNNLEIRPFTPNPFPNTIGAKEEIL